MKFLCFLLLLFTLHAHAEDLEAPFARGGFTCDDAVCSSATVLYFAGDFFDCGHWDVSVSEKVVMKSFDRFKTQGCIKAPKIEITAKEFLFTGTLSCDTSCIITTEEPVDCTLIMQEGDGEFYYVVKPAPTKKTVMISDINYVLDEQYLFVSDKPYEQALFDAMRNDDVSAFIAFLLKYPDVYKVPLEQNYFFNITSLFNAHAILEALCILFPEHLHPREAKQENSFLRYIAGRGDIPVLSILMKYGLDVREYFSLSDTQQCGCVDSEQVTLLMIAAIAGQLDMVKMLVACGADTRAKASSCGFTALNCARYCGNKAVDDYLSHY